MRHLSKNGVTCPGTGHATVQEVFLSENRDLLSLSLVIFCFDQSKFTSLRRHHCWLAGICERNSTVNLQRRPSQTRVPVVGAPEVTIEGPHVKPSRDGIFGNRLDPVTGGSHQAPRWVPIGQVRIRRSTTSNNVQLLGVGVEAGAFVQQPARGAPVGPRL